jgi:hypothetical protein
MADAALFHDASLSGQAFNVGDESISLGDLHARIVVLGREMKRRQAAGTAHQEQGQGQEEHEQQQQQQQQHAAPPLRVASSSRTVPFTFNCLRRVTCVSSFSSSSLSSLASPQNDSFLVIIVPKFILFIMLLIAEVTEICFGRSRCSDYIYFVLILFLSHLFAATMLQSLVKR